MRFSAILTHTGYFGSKRGKSPTLDTIRPKVDGCMIRSSLVRVSHNPDLRLEYPGRLKEGGAHLGPADFSNTVADRQTCSDNKGSESGKHKPGGYPEA